MRFFTVTSKSLCSTEKVMTTRCIFVTFEAIEDLPQISAENISNLIMHMYATMKLIVHRAFPNKLLDIRLQITLLHDNGQEQHDVYNIFSHSVRILSSGAGK